MHISKKIMLFVINISDFSSPIKTSGEEGRKEGRQARIPENAMANLGCRLDRICNQLKLKPLGSPG